MTMLEIREFNEDTAGYIIRSVSLGLHVHNLHEHDPERVPNPIIVNRWRREVKQFDMLMQEAEMVKGQRFADETIDISDDDVLKPSEKNVKIKARQWYAGKMAGNFTDDAGGLLVDADRRLTDDELYALAAQGRPLLEGKSERVETQSDRLEPVEQRMDSEHQIEHRTAEIEERAQVVEERSLVSAVSSAGRSSGDPQGYGDVSRESANRSDHDSATDDGGIQPEGATDEDGWPN